MLDIPVVWSEDTLAHLPEAEIWLGVNTPGTELPERAIVIRDAAVAAGATLVTATAHSDELLSRVHGAGLLNFLSTIHEEWVERGYQEYQKNVVPYVFPTE